MKKIIAILTMLVAFAGCSTLEGTVKARKEQLKEYKNVTIVAKTDNENKIEIDITNKKLIINDQVTEVVGIEVRFINPNTDEVIFWDGKKFYKKTIAGEVKEITEPDVTNWVIFGIKVQ